MGNLFQISAEYIHIMDELEGNDGELTDEILDRLNINKNELDEKLDNYRLVILDYEAQQAALKSEVERLSNRIRVKANVIQSLKDRMNIAVALYGEPNKSGSKVYESKTARYTYVYSKPVVVTDETKIRFDNEEVSPYLRGAFSFKAPADKVKGIIAILNDKFKLSVEAKPELSKTTIKPILAAGTEIDGIKIDDKAGSLRIT